MSTDVNNDKLCIKTLLFTKAIANYVIPVPTEGHKLYSCTDCGDRFVLESSYNYHLNRRSVQITYVCRHCVQTKIFYNRCNLLFHIRSHTFKSTTINVTDLKIEPLPLSCINIHNITTTTSDISLRQVTHKENSKNNTTITSCYECKKIIKGVGTAYRDRANHFMQYTNEVYTCPICLFAMPTLCGLITHLRIHLKCPPYYCPECGVHMPNKNVQYPYNHDCEGFKMMRATARWKCAVTGSCLFHPNDFKQHMKDKHFKKVYMYRSTYCDVVCTNETTMQKYSKSHKSGTKAIVFYQCELCPGKLIRQNYADQHLALECHANTNNVFPCWACGAIFNEPTSLVSHHIIKHDTVPDSVKTLLYPLLNESEFSTGNTRRVYRVVKRCDQCKRSFTYKCKYNEIHILPNVCPYKCASNLQSNEISEVQPSSTHIICHLCKSKISEDWDEIKKHYKKNHEAHQCLDVQIVLKRVNLKKYTKQNKTHAVKKTIKRVSRKKIKNNHTFYKAQGTDDIISFTASTSRSSTNNNIFCCSKCDHTCESKQLLETHIKIHKDPCMAYQCMECGQSFVVKPSFSTHLLLEHGISSVDNYINEKQCYNVNALEKCQYDDASNEPIGENQCTICREQFESLGDLRKHFRVHGMAFLKTNSSNKNSIS